jgi:hypothetical protein
MKKILPILFLALVTYTAAQQQAPAPTGTVANGGIEGMVVRFGTGEVLSKSSVELVAVGVSGTIPTTTEADGRFYFPNITPGTYRLYSRRDGFWAAEYGQRWVDGPGQAITIAPGQQLRDVKIVMTPGGVIRARAFVQ